ncbi:LuxR C-terminal-related transcriptional regulator [Microbacterium saperdae]
MARPRRLTGPGPEVRFRAPSRQPGSIPRERVTVAITEAVGANPLTIISAPSGFGKTVAATTWASDEDEIAWLALNSYDCDPARLAQGVVDALNVEAERAGRAVLLPRDPGDPAHTYHEICRAFGDVDRTIHLVVDDAHRAGEDWRRGLLGMLAEQAPDRLRIVLVGTTLLEVTSSRQRIMTPEAFVGADVLRFTESEVRQLHTQEPNGLAPESIFEETHGWPIAVRLMMIGGTRPDSDAATASGFLGDYVREHVLEVLPAGLARFVLDASVCGELTSDLAAAVTEDPRATEMLETCVRLGLFLDKFEGPHCPVYRWHATFARQCAEILRADPARAAACHRRAAAHLAGTEPISAIAHSLRAGDTDIARATLMNHWVGLVVGSQAAEIERTATEMLRHAPDDAEVLLIRACASDVLGDHNVARELFHRATGLIDGSGRQQTPAVLQLARLFIADEPAEVMRAGADVREMLLRADSTDLSDRAAINYLMGWTEIRHRGDPALPVEYFAAAAREARSSGDEELSKRAFGHLAFGQTWAGQFEAARSSLAEVRRAQDVRLPWSTYAGGSAAAAAGYVAYWAGEVDAALCAFTSVLDNGGADRSFTSIARMMIAYSSAETGDLAACRRAAIGIQDIPLEVVHGISWPAFRESSISLLEEAVGRPDRALRIARKYLECPDLPVVCVALAGVFRRAGEYPTALEMLRSLRTFADVSYVKVSTLTTAAVLRRQGGHRDAAHELCEAALSVAAAENVRLPFGPRESAVRKLLQEHVHFGTQFAPFLEGCLASEVTGSRVDALSERERDVYHQLKTARTLPEIARVLELSINTVKTHQRSIYRKLGVSSRRDAVQTTV